MMVQYISNIFIYSSTIDRNVDMPREGHEMGTVF